MKTLITFMAGNLIGLFILDIVGCKITNLSLAIGIAIALDLAIIGIVSLIKQKTD